MRSGVVSLHMKGVILGESLTPSKKLLTLGGAVPPGSARPHNVKALEKKRHG